MVVPFCPLLFCLSHWVSLLWPVASLLFFKSPVNFLFRVLPVWFFLLRKLPSGICGAHSITSAHVLLIIIYWILMSSLVYYLKLCHYHYPPHHLFCFLSTSTTGSPMRTEISVCFLHFCYLQHREQYLEHNRHSINIYWICGWMAIYSYKVVN